MPSKPFSRETLHELSAMVTRLLQHYWTATEPIAARRTQIEDWIEDLREFPLATVERACREWRRQPEPRRPLPGDIRRLCIETQASRPAAGTFDRDAYARSIGFSSWLERQDAIDDHKRRQESSMQWQRENLGAKPFKAPAVSAAAALGVTAKEFNPSPEEMAASRQQLGIDPTPQPAEERGTA